MRRNYRELQEYEQRVGIEAEAQELQRLQRRESRVRSVLRKMEKMSISQVFGHSNNLLDECAICYVEYKRDDDVV
jgi:hypothetical protein